MILKKHFLLTFVVLAWVITNISGTTSSPADGRVFSLGLLHSSQPYLEINTNETIREAIDVARGGNVPAFGEWLFSSYYGDSINYFRMSMGEPSFEPYSLRIAYPVLVGFFGELIVDVLGVDDKRFQIFSLTYIGFNYICFFLSVVLSVFILEKLNVKREVAVLLSFVPFLQLGYLKVLQSPMVNPPSVLLALAFIYSLMSQKFALSAILAFLMILTKDSLIIIGIIPFLLFVIKREFKLIPAIVVMPITFVGLRLLSEVDPLSMQYGWNVSQGDIRLDYLKGHFGSIKGVINWLIGLWYSFGPFLLIVSLGLFVSESKYKVWTYILIVASFVFIFAQLLLASRVARTLTPISVPVVLFSLAYIYHWFVDKNNHV